ncbi:MAG: hypothetical protein IT445_17210 [Phycisphaeraceae bacterium]|nr:hypothetical protein [Phycisphaeraceae bacterium]
MRRQDDESRFRRVTIGTILLVFAAAAVIIGYACLRSAEHYTSVELQRQTERALNHAPH